MYPKARKAKKKKNMICRRCNTEQGLEFYGRARVCKICMRAQQREYGKNTIKTEEQKEAARRRTRESRARNPERTRLNGRDYYYRNAQRTKEKHARARTKPGYYKKQYARAKAKRQKDVNFRLRCNLRNRLYQLLGKGSGSVSKWLDCNAGTLRAHLEAQFQCGMTWDNYGEWHVDHLIPLTWFDLTKDEEKARAMNYKNLQPLWAKDNIRKGNKIG